jgi:AhpD family alkylhydroperoxidase
MFTKMMREPLAKNIRHIKPIRYDAATGLTAQVYDQLQADFMPAPLVVLHSPVPEVMAGVWSMLRETLMAGSVNRSCKEAVAATVSKANECPFCVDAHTVMLRAISDHDVANAILQEDHERIRDPQMRALVQWMWANRGSKPDVVLPLPFSQSEAPEIIGTAVTFQYMNRMANIFLGDTLLPVQLPSALTKLTYDFYAATEGKRIVRRLTSGESLEFLPQAQLPDDLSWAAENSSVASAFAGIASVIEQSGRRVLPESVRLLVDERVQVWNGETMGMSRRWVEDAIAGMDTGHQAAARLALLTAFASYQVDAGVIESFRLQYPEDAQLIAATAWASFTAARRAGKWMAAQLKMAA